ncbi:MAG: peptidase S8 [Gomphosphaeria aponina SAG 52.96 = DSM 107014]|uniref:Peptidase S8 n=1 Tax=Gomphosphaeria aponina SAG 52.96 = DSM 107014 TaxID=1521640 RepID=A0A941JSG3_9CHRO|nr:peptidase S8 [Gomphosphaeria aponina SAG 52.96 = DSM 107014]
MKKFLLLCLFVLGLGFALFNFKGLADQGEFNSIVLDFLEDVPTTEISEQLKALEDKYGTTASLNSIYSVEDRVYVLEGDKELLKVLAKSPLRQNTEYIEPNYIYQALEIPNDPRYTEQWNLRSVNVELAWEETKGAGITVAVIDTGVSRVPDLKQTEFVKGYDFVNDKSDASDDNGHGTHVAGTIAQSTNNGYGVAGIAYEAKIMPLKVLSGSGGGTISDIADAIRFAADNGADVINMSLGGGGESKLMGEAIDYAYEKGVVIIAAAGNSNQNSASYPARYPRVISVSAVDSAGNKAPYSNYGAGVDISAPGGSEGGKILQNTIDPATGQSVFAEFQGTSMAAPHVAGVAALVKAAGITEPEQILKVLKESSRKVQEDPLNYYGAGHLDAASAVKLALKGQITFKDFFRWLRDNGYLSPRFWIDGGAVMLPAKLLMVLGSYLLAFLLRNYFPFSWSWSLNNGLIWGSSGLFFLQGLYIFDLPQWPFRLLGSSVAELGNAVQGYTALNPLFASVLIPFLLIILLSGHSTWKWFAVGTTVGVAACLLVNAVISPEVWGLGNVAIARSFLFTNALLCFGLAYLASKGENKLA